MKTVLILLCLSGLMAIKGEDASIPFAFTVGVVVGELLFVLVSRNRTVRDYLRNEP